MENGLQQNSHPDSGLPSAYAPRLLIETESGYRVFFRNLMDFCLPLRDGGDFEPVEPTVLWADVFVPSRLPWWRFAQSLVIHGLFLAGLWGASRVWLLQPQVVPPPVFSKRDVIYFPASEYLQPLDTLKTQAPPADKGEPEFSRQTILSVPPQADNTRQTIVTPPAIKLSSDVPLPNIVAWNSVTPAAPINAVSDLRQPLPHPTAIIAPPPEVQAAADRRRIDTADGVIAPPPDVMEANSRHAMPAPEAAIIAPPPLVNEQIRRLGAIDIGHSEIVPPAPQLPMGEQRTLAYRAQSAIGNVAAVPPPPSVRAGISQVRAGVKFSTAIIPPPPSLPGGSGASSRIVALNLHPIPGAPPIVSGNRRGQFAASPAGKPGASGKPGVEASLHAGNSHGGDGGADSRSGLPPGLLVKTEPNSPSAAADVSVTSPNPLLAEVKPPLRVAPRQRRAMASVSTPTAEEREVFGNRKFYSMTLNMPNLNSAGGSWVIRFAELNDNGEQGGLIAPEATRKVDPAYPLELMRTQIEGKVTLYAVIRRDGTVGNVHVLTSVDDRLDEYARAAFSRWRFLPAAKHGTAVDLEAVITIPFRARPAF